MRGSMNLYCTMFYSVTNIYWPSFDSVDNGSLVQVLCSTYLNKHISIRTYFESKNQVLSGPRIESKRSSAFFHSSWGWIWVWSLRVWVHCLLPSGPSVDPAPSALAPEPTESRDFGRVGHWVMLGTAGRVGRLIQIQSHSKKWSPLVTNGRLCSE